MIWWVIASSVNFSWIRLKIFSIGFTSDDRAGIAILCNQSHQTLYWVFLLFWIGSPSFKNNLFLKLILSLNAFGKSFLPIFAKLSPLIFPKYWVHISKPFLYDIPTRKLADLPPAPSFSPLLLRLHPSRRSRHALLLHW